MLDQRRRQWSNMDLAACHRQRSDNTRWLNSLSASLLLNIFLSFEVGFAHAIANFK